MIKGLYNEPLFKKNEGVQAAYPTKEKVKGQASYAGEGVGNRGLFNLLHKDSGKIRPRMKYDK